MKDELAVQAQILNHLNTPEDKELAQQIADLRLRSDEYEEIFQETLFIWDNAPLTKTLEVQDFESSVQKFSDRIVVKRSRFNWLRAAIIVIVPLAVFLIYPRKTEPLFLVKETKQQIDSIILSDHTRIILSANTSIKYTTQLGEKSREVTLLKGQAFFKVHREVTRPFFVSIGHSKVSVLGTSFNINYSQQHIRVAVMTGKVMFSPNTVSNSSALTAGEAISYDILKNTIEIENGANANAWMTKKLEFIDMPLDEVCKQLGAYFNKKIVFQDDLHSDKKFNANFENSSFEEVLFVLKQTYKMRIDSNAHHIIIKTL